jgi:hypothetical protein
VFTAQPTNNPINAPSVNRVAVEDALGNIVTSSTASITIGIGPNAGNGGGGTLSGTNLTAGASSGLATFTGLSMEKHGNGYTLSVTSASLPTAISTKSRRAWVSHPRNATALKRPAGATVHLGGRVLATQVVPLR